MISMVLLLRWRYHVTALPRQANDFILKYDLLVLTQMVIFLP